MRLYGKSGVARLMVGVAAGAIVMGASAAWAQSKPITVEPQPLMSALHDFGSQTGVQILYAPEILKSKVSSGVAGAQDEQSALTTILAGTGLTFRREANAYVIVQQGEGGSSPQGASVAGGGADPYAVEALIVTAQKKGENIQDVPIAISAFTMKELDAQKVEGGFDLLKAVPNVTFSKSNFSGYNFQIRGIGTQAVSATTDPGVAVAFNNTTLIVNRLFEQEYVDIERVEVLRGPQGTLYGRNATGGVINVISAKPRMGEFLGELKLEAGNFNAQRVRGHVNVPIGESLAVRGAFAMTKRDGYGYNEASESNDTRVFGDHVREDVDGRDLWTGRITVGWEPTDTLRVNLMWEHFDEDDNRTRTSKQLCHRDTGTEITPGPGTSFVVNDSGFLDASQYYFGPLSQGCKPGSLYDDDAFGTPNGASLPYVSGLFWGQHFSNSPVGHFVLPDDFLGIGTNPYISIPAQPARPGCQYVFGTPINPPCDPTVPAGQFGQPTPAIPAPIPGGVPCSGPSFEMNAPVDTCNPDVYRGGVQSRDIRSIYSEYEPVYRAKSDIIELSFDHDWGEGLTFSSQTVYAEDEYFATQDYNRFRSFPIWPDASAFCNVDCSDDPDTGYGTWAPIPDGNGDFLRDENGRRIGYYANLMKRPEGAAPGSPGVVCDPQLGCSDTLRVQDLSRSESKQFNQEFRLVSSFEGDWNFSLGANYTRFETFNDYFVFSNALTVLTNMMPFNIAGNPDSSYNTPTSTFGRCFNTSSPESLLAGTPDGNGCVYVDPTPLEAFASGQGGDGHNYFRSANPYELTSAAVFGELYWNVTDTLKLTTGLRYTWDKKVFSPIPSQLLLSDYRDFVPEGEGPEACQEFRVECPFAGTGVNGRGSPANPDIVQEWREPTGRVVLDWQPDLGFTDETMVYASYAHGYKGGGANPPAVAEPAKRFLDRASGGFPDMFEAEYVNAYEIGTKNTILGGAATLNLGAFYYDYTDYQVSRIVDRRAVNENFDAEVWGAELEARFSPTRDLTFNAAIGYLQTRVGDGERSIDLIDRTDGGNRHFAAAGDAVGTQGRPTDFPEGFDQWVVVQPWLTASSNCVVPLALLQANYATSNTHYLHAFCPSRNAAGGTTAAGLTAYFDEDGNLITDGGRRFDPAIDAPNGGAGFFKDLGGNELPNAPHWTFSLGSQYTMALPGGWDATLRGDFYWQSQSFARIYNLAPYDKLRAWTNTNISLWVENPDWGVKAEVYVKNVFDEAPITGTFLNSDDSGLTTNIFTLDPRLVGVSVTKSF